VPEVEGSYGQLYYQWLVRANVVALLKGGVFLCGGLDDSVSPLIFYDNYN
jgi:hypothetical protein